MAEGFLSKVDEYGFERGENFDSEAYSEFLSSYIQVLAKRSKRWYDVYHSGNRSWERSSTLKRFVRKGIPAEYRAKVWLITSGGAQMRESLGPGFYKNLLSEDLNPEVVETIKLDLSRTFPDNIYFKTMAEHQIMLFNVLAAYAHHNPKVGYCQGLNYIAGLLLLATKNEETSFWLLKVLVEQILEDYYSLTMEGVIVDMEVLLMLVRFAMMFINIRLNNLFSIKVPDVYARITKEGIPWAVITAKWFICLFAEVLPVETVFRIWDCLFYEGSKIIFRVGLSLIMNNKNLLLASSDCTELMENLKKITQNIGVLRCHEFIETLFKTPGKLSRNTIDRLREQVSQDLKSKQSK